MAPGQVPYQARPPPPLPLPLLPLSGQRWQRTRAAAAPAVGVVWVAVAVVVVAAARAADQPAEEAAVAVEAAAAEAAGRPMPTTFSTSSTNRPEERDGPQKYDKNKFLQANFRFLVSEAAVGAERRLTPITPCGHIFSFPAIMHLLVNHGGDQLRRSAPCPLCFAPVVARELRLVRVRRVGRPAAGQSLTLALIRRNRTSIITQPVDTLAAAAAAAAAAADAARADGVGGGWGGGGGGEGEAASPFDRNCFAKFVVGGEGDAGELWRGAAAQLAASAMQVLYDVTEVVTKKKYDVQMCCEEFWLTRERLDLANM
ncbi:RING finger protein 10 [Tetrabaena socialis]|uniref:RING finger protein 10 n=1 Tax=Tetrabaena socialis TaxID=47790 RepID=A0A2J8ADY5_9CHLO|nr:RING finger protein 10 [Tetrabaena socialis]|eukprot:PNH10724.1 RING finger protein 10 [Tetrabaena socialis]